MRLDLESIRKSWAGSAGRLGPISSGWPPCSLSPAWSTIPTWSIAPATLQCIVLRAAPSNLLAMVNAGGIATAAVVSFLDRAPTPDSENVYRSPSLISRLARSSPPALLLHGDSDDTVPYEQSVALKAALDRTGVAAKLV